MFPLKSTSSLFKCFITLLLVIAPLVCQSQNRDEVNLPDSTNIVVRRVDFTANDNVSDNTLQNLVRTHTNTELFGIPGLTPLYGIYQLTGGAFGESPVYLDYQTVASDIERIIHYYESIGFFSVEVDTNIAISEKKLVLHFLLMKESALLSHQ